jgi:hypothetical protein
VEHRGILRNVRHHLPQCRLRDPIDGLTADQNLAAFDVREPQQQACQRRFAAAGAAHESDPGALRDPQRQALEEQRLIGRVSEAHVPQLDAEVGRRERGGRLGVHDRRRLEEQRGELRGLGERPLEVAIDAVEFPHHACRRRVVAERHEHRLEARPGAAADRERRDQPECVGSSLRCKAPPWRESRRAR